MFLVNRYGNLVGQTYIRLEEAGLFTYHSRPVCCSLTILLKYYLVLVLMRAWAIWGTRKRVTQVLIMGYICWVLMLMGATTYGINKKAQFPHFDSVKICWLSHVASFVLDSLVFVLTMRSLRKYSREFQYLYPSGLLHILVRDAIMFFVVSIFGDAWTIVSWTAYSKDPRYFLAKAFSSPLLSVAGQRLVLNLKSLKTRTYTTNDISHEVDRQLEAFVEVSITPDGMGDPG
ncbi:hypothetical protein M405DRAFT_814417, partial [Rhizopogon salebrosus TDB-379]